MGRAARPRRRRDDTRAVGGARGAGLVRAVAGGLALTVRFLLELAALAALGWYGSTVAWWLAVLLPVAAALLWGAFAAPKARWPSEGGRLAVEVLVFGGAAAALVAAGHLGLGIAFAAVAFVDDVAVRRIA